MKITNLTIPHNGKRIWREDAFDGGMNRVDLDSELSALGFEVYSENHNTWYHLRLPKDQRAGRNMDAYEVWIDLDLIHQSADDQEEIQTTGDHITVFTPNTLVMVRFVGRGHSRAYRLGDLWEGMRTQWLRMIAYGNDESGYNEAIQADCREWKIE